MCLCIQNHLIEIAFDAEMTCQGELWSRFQPCTTARLFYLISVAGFDTKWGHSLDNLWERG